MIVTLNFFLAGYIVNLAARRLGERVSAMRKNEKSIVTVKKLGVLGV